MNVVRRSLLGSQHPCGSLAVSLICICCYHKKKGTEPSKKVLIFLTSALLSFSSPCNLYAHSAEGQRNGKSCVIKYQCTPARTHCRSNANLSNQQFADTDITTAQLILIILPPSSHITHLTLNVDVCR